MRLACLESSRLIRIQKQPWDPILSSAIADVASTAPSSWPQGCCNADGDENAALVKGPSRVRGLPPLCIAIWLETVWVSGLRGCLLPAGVKKPA